MFLATSFREFCGLDFCPTQVAVRIALLTSVLLVLFGRDCSSLLPKRLKQNAQFCIEYSGLWEVEVFFFFFFSFPFVFSFENKNFTFQYLNVVVLHAFCDIKNRDGKNKPLQIWAMEVQWRFWALLSDNWWIFMLLELTKHQDPCPHQSLQVPSLDWKQGAASSFAVFHHSKHTDFPFPF